MRRLNIWDLGLGLGYLRGADAGVAGADYAKTPTVRYLLITVL